MLREQLIKALKVFIPDQPEKKKTRIKLLLETINEIPQKDFKDTPENYNKVLKLIFLLYLKWPEVKNTSLNIPLKKLGKECIKKGQLTLSETKESKYEKKH